MMVGCRGPKLGIVARYATETAQPSVLPWFSKILEFISVSLSSGTLPRYLSLFLPFPFALARRGSDPKFHPEPAAAGRQNPRILSARAIGTGGYLSVVSRTLARAAPHTADNTFLTYLYVGVAQRKPLHKYRCSAKHAAAVGERRVGKPPALKDLLLIVAESATGLRHTV